MTQNDGKDLYSNKLQIRARLLSAIVNLQQKASDLSFIKHELSDLEKISDKKAVLSILEKELLKENTEARDYTITFLLRNLVSEKELESALFENLANPQISDLQKAKLVNILREEGKHFDYGQYMTYFENPDVIIDADTEKLLENAKVNPESQIDFLDFLSALPYKEKEMLLSSLAEDYDGENLANILIPIVLSNPYSEIAQFAINSIGQTRSKLGYSALFRLIDDVDDIKVQANIQKSLNLLKLSGIKEDVADEYYKELFAKSPILDCIASFPDGQGNVGLIFSRKNISKFIQMFALVINDVEGIVDCFGFNEISKSEYDRILSKFYQSNDVVYISAEFAKYLMVSAEKTTRRIYSQIPYEYIVWKTIANDVEYKDFDLKSGLKTFAVSSTLLKQLYSHSYFDTWFVSSKDNEKFKDAMEKIYSGKISDVSKIEEIINEYKSEILNPKMLLLLNNRLTLSAFLAQQDERDASSQILYSLTIDSPVRDEFLYDYLQKSVYQHFLTLRDRYYSMKNATSIFAKKQKSDEIDIDFVELCIKNIENAWVE